MVRNRRAAGHSQRFDGIRFGCFQEIHSKKRKPQHAAFTGILSASACSQATLACPALSATFGSSAWSFCERTCMAGQGRRTSNCGIKFAQHCGQDDIAECRSQSVATCILEDVDYRTACLTTHIDQFVLALFRPASRLQHHECSFTAAAICGLLF